MNSAGGRSPVGFPVALSVFLLAGILWLGGETARLVVWSELLEPGTANLAAGIDRAAERMAYALLAKLSFLAIASYAVLILSSVVVLVLSPWRVRRHGWLLMSALLLYLFVPVECYTLSLDVRLAYLRLFTDADLPVLRELFLARTGALAGAPLIGLLCAYTIVLLAVFRPLPGKGENAG